MCPSTLGLVIRADLLSQQAKDEHHQKPLPLKGAKDHKQHKHDRLHTCTCKLYSHQGIVITSCHQTFTELPT